MSRRIKEVMTSENLITTSRSITLEEAPAILQEHKIEKLPVVDENGKLAGLLTFKDITKVKDNPLSSKDSGRLRVLQELVLPRIPWNRIQALIDAKVDAIVIDTAHGTPRCDRYAETG